MIVYLSGGTPETREQVEKLLAESGHRYQVPDPGNPEQRLDYMAEADAVLMLNASNQPDLMVELGIAIGIGRVVYLVDPGAQRSVFMGISYMVRTFNFPWEALEAIDKDDFVELEG